MTKLRTHAALAALALAFTVGCDDDATDPDDDGPTTVAHTFTYVKPAGAPALTSVNLAGSFNEWSTTARPMTQQTNGSWTTTLNLAPGTYQYKFVMNGGTWPQNMCNDATWGDATTHKVDAAVTSCVDDGNGGQNAVLVIAAP